MYINLNKIRECHQYGVPFFISKILSTSVFNDDIFLYFSGRFVFKFLIKNNNRKSNKIE